MNEPENAPTVEGLLPVEMLEEFRGRAPGYDAENIFFAEDFTALRNAGYLTAPIPIELGGAGLSLEELARAQRRLASYAPATALGVNMHLVWVQVACFLHDRGSDSLDWVLRDALNGEIFAFGISEAGNDAVLMDSATVAEPDEEGGYLLTGTKIFTTLSPVWTRLGVHARCELPGLEPHLVFGFVRREDPTVRRLDSLAHQEVAAGPYVDQTADPAPLAQPEVGRISHPGRWNPLGMRATQSWTTRLEGVRIAPEDVAARIAPFDGRDPLVLAIFSSFSILTASVYAGIADRALELATAAANRLLPRADGGAALRLEDPEVASRLTGSVLEHRASADALAILARDVDERRQRDDWFLALAAMRNRVTDEARSAIDVAMRIVGASGFQADSELARLYRDVLAGLFHPSSSRALAQTVRASLKLPEEQ